MNRNLLYQTYEKIERRITPTLKYAERFYEDVLRETLRDGMSWLDVGCGHHALAIWREEDEKKLVRMAGNVMGLDEDWPSLRKHRSIKNRVVGDIRALPFPEGTFDLVTANMVVEHLEKPEGPFSEIRRVLKPGGLFVFHTPNAYGYSTVFARMIPERLKTWLIQLLEGRPPEDVFKTHYRVNTESQIRQVSQRAGLDIDRVRYVASCAKFALILPLALFELFWIMLLLTHPFRSLRTNLLVTLVKPSSAEPITG